MKRTVFLLLLVLVGHFPLFAQDFQEGNNPWMLGVFVNGVNNSGEALSRPFKIRQKYAFSYPFKISLEKRFLYHFGAEISTSFNTFTEGKIYNYEPLEQSINYFSVDLVFKYYWTNLILNPRRRYVESFLLAGPGRLILDSEKSFIANVGLGFQIYLSERFRIALQATGKTTPRGFSEGTKLLQVDFGILARFD